MRPSLILTALVALLAACAAAEPTTPPPLDPCAAAGASALVASDVSGLRRFAVAARSTDGCIQIVTDSHLVAVSPAVTLRGKLAVILPGTGGAPKNYELMLREAASQGFHAIGLAYPNDEAVGDLCGGRPATCQGEVRLETVAGVDASPLLQVGSRDAIQSRLASLLRFLRTNDPARGWGAFLQADTVNWSLVHVGGHSQGGGHSLFLAQRHRVARAVAFGSGGDLMRGTRAPAAWVEQPFRTPAADLFGFINTQDEIIDATDAINAWTVIGLGSFGPARSVDGASSPWGGSHMLTTSAAPPSVLGTFHGTVATDQNTPRDGGVPRFASVWRYTLLGL